MYAIIKRNHYNHWNNGTCTNVANPKTTWWDELKADPAFANTTFYEDVMPDFIFEFHRQAHQHLQDAKSRKVLRMFDNGDKPGHIANVTGVPIKQVVAILRKNNR